jgi:cell division protein FtsB
MFHFFNIKEDVCRSKQTIDRQTEQIRTLTEDGTKLQNKMNDLQKQVADYDELKRQAEEHVPITPSVALPVIAQLRACPRGAR